MKLGIISDTRIPGGATEVPREVISAFDGVDLILHAGGIHASRVLDWLEEIAPVKAVGRIQGGHSEQPQPLSIEGMEDSRVTEQQVLEVEGHIIGMVNNLELNSFSDDIFPGVIAAHRLPDGTLSQILQEFFGTPVNIVIFGRTMYQMIEEHQGILFVNPGSPTLPKNLVKLGSVAVLELFPMVRHAKVLNLSDFS